MYIGISSVKVSQSELVKLRVKLRVINRRVIDGLPSDCRGISTPQVPQLTRSVVYISDMSEEDCRPERAQADVSE